jgi:hypothetical protein
MTCRTRIWLAALVLFLGMAGQASAFPPFPPFQWPWCEPRDCPRSSYCCLHYLTPSIYTFRAYHTTPRYVYGCPSDPNFVGYRIDSYHCRASEPIEQAYKYMEVGRDKAPVAEGASPPEVDKPH